MESLIFFGKTISIIIPFVLYVWMWGTMISYFCLKFYNFAFLIFMIGVGLFLSTTITLAHIMGS